MGPNPAIEERIAQTKKALEEARSELVAVRDDPGKGADKDHEEKLKAARQKVNKIQAELIGLSDPALHGNVAFGVREGFV